MDVYNTTEFFEAKNQIVAKMAITLHCEHMSSTIIVYNKNNLTALDFLNETTQSLQQEKTPSSIVDQFCYTSNLMDIQNHVFSKMAVHLHCGHLRSTVIVKNQNNLRTVAFMTEKTDLLKN